ncbi:MAG: hypothetical protein IPK68_11180 [Bdellovibrionales bacterium]|nr:hypothetical protein [Bdellovibrionales bacterium]
MYWEKRQNTKGEHYYTFAYFDNKVGKNIRLKKSAIPSDITTDLAAEKFCRLKEAEHESIKMRILKKLEWKSKFYDFNELSEIFKVEMQKKSPNNWQNSCYYLEQYVLPFFLSQKQSNNINNWNLFYQEFIDWLLIVKPLKGSSATISYSTRNHIITTLNNFIAIMKQKNKIERVDKCQKFPKHLVPMRDIDDVYSEQEILEISARLSGVTAGLADLFHVLINTGLRISECLALSADDFYVGEPEHETLKNALVKHDIKILGYLSIESQLGDKGKVRDASGKVIRKPLKGRKRIKSGEGRIIPIFDRDIFNILAKRYNAQIEYLNAGICGADSKNGDVSFLVENLEPLS